MSLLHNSVLTSSIKQGTSCSCHFLRSRQETARSTEDSLASFQLLPCSIVGSPDVLALSWLRHVRAMGHCFFPLIFLKRLSGGSFTKFDFNYSE